VCPGCGYVAEGPGGPGHAYIGASAECWQRYGELLVRPAGGQRVVDAYAVQHPGVDERRSRQSVAVHLVSLCGVLEHPRHDVQGVALLRRALQHPREYPWLPPPPLHGTPTVDDVLRGPVSVEAWVRAVWRAWEPHHATVADWWADAVRAGRGG
jgi:hypothetical protein